MIHVILDNYAAQQHPKVLAWLARHPRWTFHFASTSGSWLNAVDIFFSALICWRLKRGAFRSIVELQAAIDATSPSTTAPSLRPTKAPKRSLPR